MVSNSSYFEKGLITKRDLSEALLNSGGLSNWDPILEPNKIIAGTYLSPGSFVLTNNFNGTNIDDIVTCNKGTIIYFFQESSLLA